MQNETIRVYKPREARMIDWDRSIENKGVIRIATARISGMHQATLEVGGITRVQLEELDVIDEKERTFRVRLDAEDISRLLEDHKIRDPIRLMTTEVCLYIESGKIIGVSKLPEYK